MVLGDAHPAVELRYGFADPAGWARVRAAAVARAGVGSFVARELAGTIAIPASDSCALSRRVQGWEGGRSGLQ
jgi:hypothetical protein